MALLDKTYQLRSIAVNGGVSICSRSPSIRQKRAIPLYWCSLPLGNSNLPEQTLALQQVFPLLKKYKVTLLGDREFCSVDLGNWLKAIRVSFCLRLKKNPCVETEKLIWQRLDQLYLFHKIVLQLVSIVFVSQFQNIRKKNFRNGFGLKFGKQQKN
jgi:hypothetical protein